MDCRIDDRSNARARDMPNQRLIVAIDCAYLLLIITRTYIRGCVIRFYNGINACARER